MKNSNPVRELAKKFLYNEGREDFVPLDSLVKLVAHAYTEEEASVVCLLGYVPKSADTIAKKANRPVHEVEPILKSLSDRVLITGLKDKKGTIYGFMPLVPGVFEAQIIRSNGGKGEYYKEFARLFEEFYAEVGDFLKPHMKLVKDLKVMRIIPVERALDSNPKLNIVAFSTDRYSEMVDRNKSFALVQCPCRTTMDMVGKGCDKPKDVCSAMGWVADIVVEKGLGRRASKEEFLDAKRRANEAGLVNLVDNMQDPLQVCSCCGCCCGVLRIANQHNIPAIFTKSHFESVVNAQTCSGCETCVGWCPMKAITMVNGSATIDLARCIGCGVCVGKCDDKAIVMRERKDYSPPADNIVHHAIHRYLEVKGRNRDELSPRLALGLSKLVSKFVQPKVSGPNYKPTK